jgi:hypothetical protein
MNLRGSVGQRSLVKEGDAVRVEARTASAPDVPTASRDVRMSYWQQLYERSKNNVDRAMEVLEQMRRES